MILARVEGRPIPLAFIKSRSSSSSTFFPAVSIALVAGVIVSLVTPKRTITDDEALHILEEERKQMEMHDEVEALPEEAVES